MQRLPHEQGGSRLACHACHACAMAAAGRLRSKQQGTLQTEVYTTHGGGHMLHVSCCLPGSRGCIHNS